MQKNVIKLGKSMLYYVDIKYSNKTDTVTVSSYYPTYLFDAVTEYTRSSYGIKRLYYNKSWLWATKYYVELYKITNQLDIKIGPVSIKQ